MIQASRLLRLTAIAIVLGAPAPSNADSCDTNHGRDLMSWVVNHAGRQSRALTTNDYTARFNNGRLGQYENIGKDALTQSKLFSQYATELRGMWPNGSSPIEAGDAVRIQAQSISYIDKLNSSAIVLRDIQDILSKMEEKPAVEEFIRAGHHHVGRSTLLASITALGLMAESTLRARYAVQVRASFDTEGKGHDFGAEFGEGNETIQELETVGSQFAIYYWNAYVAMAVAAYYIIKFAVVAQEYEECRKHIDAENELARAAVEKLGEVLPTTKEQFAEYERIITAAQNRFSTMHGASRSVLTRLDSQWQLLMAAAIANERAAATVLTSSRLDALRRAYEEGDSLQHVFDEVALSQLTKEIGAAYADVFASERSVGRACRNANGVQVAEDHLDLRRQRVAELKTLERVAAYAPLHEWMRRLRSQLEKMPSRAIELTSSRATLPCSVDGVDGIDIAAVATLSLPDSRVGPNIEAWSELSDSVEMAEAHAAKDKPIRFSKSAPPAVDGVAPRTDDVQVVSGDFDGHLIFCETVKIHGEWVCAGAGPRLADEFQSGPGGPYRRATRGANDGGFAQDAKKLQGQIDAGRANIERRIDKLAQEQASIEKAVPSWLDHNESAMKNMEKNLDARLEVETQELEDTLNNIADLLGPIQGLLRDAAIVDGSKEKLADVVRSEGVVDPSIPDLPSEAVLPDGPDISGLTHRDRVYGGTSTSTERQIVREGQKTDEIDDPALRARYREAMAGAARFKGVAGDVYSEALLLEAKSIRYAEKGRIPSPSALVVTPDGSVSQEPYLDGSRPESSFVQRLASFDLTSARFDQQAATIEQALSGDGAVDPIPRRIALQFASELHRQANLLFFGGQVVEGEALLSIATTVADVVSSWTPGVGLGRDIYEAVSGRNLLDGSSLDDLSRAAAIFGAVTGGYGSKAGKVGKAVSHAMDRVSPRWVKILDGQFHVLAQKIYDRLPTYRGIHVSDVVFDEHAFDRGFSQEELVKVINEGHPVMDSAPELIRTGKLSPSAVPGLEHNTGLMFVLPVTGADGKALMTVATTVDGAPKVVTGYIFDRANATNLDELGRVSVPGTNRRRYEVLPKKEGP